MRIKMSLVGTVREVMIITEYEYRRGKGLKENEKVSEKRTAI
jgi:hypothetical protein